MYALFALATTTYAHASTHPTRPHTPAHVHAPTPTSTRQRVCQGQVTAVVGFNPSKKYEVSPEQRVELIERACREDPDLKNVRAKVVSGYIWRHAFANKVTRMYRGIRSWVSRLGASHRTTQSSSHTATQTQSSKAPKLQQPLPLPLPTDSSTSTLFRRRTAPRRPFLTCSIRWALSY